MIKTTVIGGCGKMGQRIIDIINNSEGIVLSGCVEYAGHSMIGTKIKSKGREVSVSANLGDIISDTDVVIDFSSPESTFKNIKQIVDNKKAVVIGTTGFTNEEKGELERAVRNIPCVLSPNMGIGINVMCKVLKEIAPILEEDFDIEIIEAHHRMKKDAPSGTAMKIAKVIADSINRDLAKVGRYSRHGMIGERKKGEIGIQTIRAGDIVGEHTVIFGGIGERLEITHRAQSRDTFAKGAVIAAKWVFNKPNGMYDMEDVLGI